jgi:LmbE family N-acetylglucosaminyl deacetylase
MTVLVIAPHPDDECIGCGGAICRHVQRGDEVHAVFLTSGELGLKELPREQAWQMREQEARNAARVLQLTSVEFLRCPDWMLGDEAPGASEKLTAVLQKLAPELIYLPHPHEWHPDHKATSPALREALRASGIATPKLRGYEVWTPLAEYDHVENISDVMDTKLKALGEHRSQITQLDYVRAVRGLNEFRGAMAGRCRYAEVFQELAYP